MNRLDQERRLNESLTLLHQLIVAPLPPLPERAYHDTAYVEYGGISLVVGGDYEPPCDQWSGGFDVCSVRVADSRTDIIGLFSGAQLKAIGDLCYWSIRNNVDALEAAAK